MSAVLTPTPSGLRMQVDVLIGGPGREAPISRRSGAAVVEALRLRHHDVAVVEVGRTLDLAALRPQAVVFNLIHGTYGEDGQLQLELERAQRHFVGSDSVVSALCMDKNATKQRLVKAGLRVAWGVCVDLSRPFQPRDLRIPNHAGLVLKPNSDGSSVGLRMIANPSFLLPEIESIIREGGPRSYLIEEKLPGPEYTVAVLELESGVHALPALVITPPDGIFDYQAKYERSDTKEETVRDAALCARLGEIALAAHAACGCRDISRCDIMRTSDGEYAVLEINTLPGMTTSSLTPKAAAADGIAFAQLVEHLARRAYDRQQALENTP